MLKRILEHQNSLVDDLYDARDEVSLPTRTGLLTMEDAPQDVQKKFNSLHEKLNEFGIDFKDYLTDEKKRGMYHMLLGKLMNLTVDHASSAVENLEKALNLNPNLAWPSYCLSVWDPDDEARIKLEEASAKLAAQTEGVSWRDSVSNDRLRCRIFCDRFMLNAKLVLSILSGDADNGDANLLELLDECQSDANEAARCDVRMKESISPKRGWYCLGVAYLIRWLATRSADMEPLFHSLKAFSKSGTMINNVYCRHNMALASKYSGDYESALAGFMVSAATNPEAPRQMERIAGLLKEIKTASPARQKAGPSASPASQKDGASASVKKSGRKQSRQQTLDQLNKGSNNGKILRGKVCRILETQKGPMLHFYVSDANDSYFVLSLYGVPDGAIHEGDNLVLHDPIYRSVDFSWEGETYEYYSIMLNSLDGLEVNSSKLQDTTSLTFDDLVII